ncbi:MAG TPA: hypothetical protein VIR61_07700 [Sulfuricaulis sp.]
MVGHQHRRALTRLVLPVAAHRLALGGWIVRMADTLRPLQAEEALDRA